TLDAATASARTLVAAPATRAEDVAELAVCLAVTRLPADRALLEKLRAGGAPGVRARATALLATGAHE
ncbi:MAG TPA: hypothetical protein VHJ20_10545, partial [Polyangia bacterium]|nr:hypothetical protein [Polyangia bacterium]